MRRESIAFRPSQLIDQVLTSMAKRSGAKKTKVGHCECGGKQA